MGTTSTKADSLRYGFSQVAARAKWAVGLRIEIHDVGTFEVDRIAKSIYGYYPGHVRVTGVNKYVFVYRDAAGKLGAAGATYDITMHKIAYTGRGAAALRFEAERPAVSLSVDPGPADFTRRSARSE